MTPEESALAQELIQAFMARVAKKPPLDAATKARIVAVRDELTAIITLIGESAEQETTVEPVKPVEPVAAPLPVPASIEAAEVAATAPKKSKWGWLKKAAPYIGVAAGLLVPGGGIIQQGIQAVTSINSVHPEASTELTDVLKGAAGLLVAKTLADKTKKE